MKKPFTTSHWTAKNARSVCKTENNTFPVFDPNKLNQLMSGYQMWDYWNVKDENGFVANVLGFKVIVALVRPTNADFSQGERIAYFYSADGVHYSVGGFLHKDCKLYDDVREWSGSTILRDDGKLQTFYTVAYGGEFGGVWQTVQRLATSIQNVSVSENSLHISDPVYHSLLGGACEPDGCIYETPAQASEKERRRPTMHSSDNGSDQTENNCMRDPSFFRDSRTGERYLAFEGNTGASFFPSGYVKEDYVSAKGMPSYGFAPTPDMLKANGCVGLIRLTNDQYTYGHFMKPWLTANLATDEIERINVIEHDGGVYLFCVGHGNKNAMNSENKDLINRDYMLGFRADYFGGPLTPLNGNGVVVQQKSYGDMYQGQEQNEQYVYSWSISKEKGDKNVFKCIAYSNYCNTGNGIEACMNAGPTIKIKIDRLSTKIVDMEYDVQPERKVEIEK